MTKQNYWLGFALGIPIGLVCYFAVVAALPVLGAKTWIVLDHTTFTSSAPKKY